MKSAKKLISEIETLLCFTHGLANNGTIPRDVLRRNCKEALDKAQQLRKLLGLKAVKITP